MVAGAARRLVALILPNTLSSVVLISPASIMSATWFNSSCCKIMSAVWKVELVNIDSQRRRVVDQADHALRRENVGHSLEVLIGRGQRRNPCHRRQIQFIDLLLHRLGVIDDVMRTEIKAPFDRLRP